MTKTSPIPIAPILVALGANLPSRFGAPAETLCAAKNEIRNKGIMITAESSTWLTAPVPVSDQPWYHNEIIRIETALDPFSLLEALQEIETAFGRTRWKRNEARVLDLDLIAYRNMVSADPDLSLPHPRMHERAFVLEPLKEVAPEWVHPAAGISVETLLKDLPEGQEIQRLDEEEAA